MSSPVPLISCENIRVSFGRTVALDGVSVEVEQGEFVALTGSSGSGKSTLLQVLAGILRPTTGSVSFAGIELGAISDRERSRIRMRDMGFVFQSADLVPELSLLENVSLPLELLGSDTRAARDRARILLSELGINGDTASRPQGAVSGGQAQRAALARALLHQPRVLFADEPTGALDTRNSAHVMDALLTARRSGLAVVLVTHDPDLALFADRQVVLRDGCVVA